MLVGSVKDFIYFKFFFNALRLYDPYGKPWNNFFLPPGALSPKSKKIIWILAKKHLLNPMAASVWSQYAPKNCCPPDLKKKCTKKLGFVTSNHGFKNPSTKQQQEGSDTMLELMKSNSEDSQDHVHANNLSKGSQWRKSKELGKNRKRTWERTRYANTRKFVFTICKKVIWNTMREPEYKELEESSRTS